MNEKIKFFKERILSYEKRIKTLKSKFNDFSIYRLGVFIAFSAFAIWCLNVRLLTPLLFSIPIFIVIFGLIVKKHNQIKKEMELNKKLLDINQEEIDRLNYQFDGIVEGGEFVDEKHIYSDDLDIFGRNSLFQLINRAGTTRGMQLVAKWLKKPSKKEDIETRQKAVTEIRTMLDWRQKMQAHGRIKSNTSEHEQAFFHWLSGEDMIRNRPFYRLLPYFIIPLSSALIICYFMELLSLSVFVIPIIISSIFLYKIAKYSKATYEMTQSGVSILESVKNIVLLIEEVKFNDKYLSGLQASLKPQNIIASEKISDLRKIFDWLSERAGGMYWIFNTIFLLDFIFLARAEKWRANYKDEVSNWFDAIAEFEALNSIAAFSYSNDQYAFPEISEKTYYIHGKAIGHPLIPETQRVNNDFDFEGKGKTCIVTGSNMAGKSTFLRTIGINMVLAYAGAPVCAESLQLSYFNVFTSMRTKDNLEENISSFYAELLRLKMLLETISENNTVFYLLDEILKGTNSVDRHIGAESLILQLNALNTFGLISTHDLKLGELDKKNNSIVNYNFSSEIQGNEIIFDYKLRKGICQSTNASQMMAKMGIKVKT